MTCKSKLITIAVEINEGFDWLDMAKFGMKNFSNDVAKGYIKFAERSIKKVESMLEKTQ